MQKEVLTVDDISEMFAVSKSAAYDYVRAIRSVSDTLGIVGKVHRQDYELWLKERLGKQVTHSKRSKSL